MNKTVIFVKDNFEFFTLMCVFIALLLVFTFAEFILPQIGLADSSVIQINPIQIDYVLLNSLPVHIL